MLTPIPALTAQLLFTLASGLVILAFTLMLETIARAEHIHRNPHASQALWMSGFIAALCLCLCIAALIVPAL